MPTSSESIYCNTLVAVFRAAFKLGFDPYALAAQAKVDVASYLEMPPTTLSEGAERVIDESLIVAKLINENWPIPDPACLCDERYDRTIHSDDYPDFADCGIDVVDRPRD